VDTSIATVLRLEVKVRALISQHQYEQAETYCQMILGGPKDDQRYGPAQVLMAQIYFGQGRFGEAYQYAQQAEQWLVKRQMWGWVRKCQEILMQTDPRHPSQYQSTRVVWNVANELLEQGITPA
jgi:hypothetical protein